MTLINFGHPFTPDAAAAAASLGFRPEDTVNIPVQIEWEQPVVPQMVTYVDQAIRAGALFIVPPSLPIVAAYVTAELLKRAVANGHFFGLVVVSRIQGIPPRFIPTETIILHRPAASYQSE